MRMCHQLGGEVGSALLSGICFLFSLYPCLPMAVEVPVVPKQILVYGGNGFIGSSTVERFISAGYKVTLVNRGNWYWDSGFTVRPFVTHIKCDRMQSISKCPELFNYVSSTEKIDAVVDFSAYHPQSVIETLDLLNGKAQLYIYISTDSVYEVCVKNHTDPTVEDDAVRPMSQEQRENFESQESYGHRKLLCEEVLTSYRRDRNGPPFVSLRLPDVVGPRDNTYRWWIYQMWMKLRPFLEKDVVVPESVANKPLSLVYVNDIAELIFKLIQMLPPGVVDQAYNLALRETPTLMKLLEDIRGELNLTNIQILTSTQTDTIQLFPSVFQGSINISKAENNLNWNPTKWEIVLRDTVKFYEQAISVTHLQRERNEIIRTMQTYFTTKPYNVIRGLKNMYGLAYPEPRDEL
uniref:NAD-dependent epimerase/dehydratase domain-containing protein n=1 Tax=Arion vulgaris TaxID=1028688 RepID=A0A0B7AQY8_9EUPU